MFRVPSHPAQEVHEKMPVNVSSRVGCVRGVRLRCVSEASEFGSASRRVPAFNGVFELRSASEHQSRQSPKMALGPTLQGLKRAAEAKKVERIAGRLAALAGRNRARTAHLTIRRPFDA
ncbi:MAG TPA: hypothetical protein VH913_05715 [Hyphomicrobiaceae bacterium]|jgi:hypothetical protein